MAETNGNGRIRRSVIDRPGATATTSGPPAPTYDSQILWFVAQFADEILPWGRSAKTRDRQLRDFIMTESVFASALGIICSRNASFDWFLDGPESAVKRLQYVLETANEGLGWTDFITKLTIDVSTQDSSAFVELVREADNPSAALIAINNLDAARCWHTGIPEEPVVYQDRKNKYHSLKWYEVAVVSEMPTAIEGLYGMQYCALSRMLRAAQILRNISQYKYEKTGGRQSQAVHLVKGVSAQAVQDAILQHKAHADNTGQMRWMPPVIVGSPSPTADIGHDTLEIATLPDGYDEEVTFKQYIAQIAMAFRTDYQEFAPLPGGNLGTSAQSQVLSDKSRGKGSALFMTALTQMFNFRALPKNVEFGFEEQDLEQEHQEAEVRKLRAEERAVRITSGELSVTIAQQRAEEDGDLSPEQLEALGAEDSTPDVTVESGTQPEAQLGDGTVNISPAPASVVTPGQPPAAVAARTKEDDESVIPADRLAVEEEVAATIEQGFARIRENLRKRMLSESQ